VERPDPDTLNAIRSVGQQAHDPFAHLLSRFVREGDRQDVAWIDIVGVDHVRDAMREHTGLATAGAGENEERPRSVLDSRSLGWV
jgi:hypothetical protein